MAETKVDYMKVLRSKQDIDMVLSEIYNTPNDLEEKREQIINLGKDHDDCFSSVSDDVEYELNNIIQKSKEFSSDIYAAVVAFAKSEGGLNLTLSLTGLDSMILDDKTLKELYENTFNQKLAGYDYDYYENLFEKSLSNASGERAKSAAAAMFLVTSFPHMNYFWGGGHINLTEGLDPTWGQSKTVTSPGGSQTGTVQPNSFDCSGYVSWALKNGGYDISQPMVVDELENLGENIPLTSATNKVEVGDLASMDGHVGMVIGVDGNEITVSHCSGTGGMNITKMDTTTGKVTEDWNPEANRVGQNYFTNIVKVNYDN